VSKVLVTGSAGFIGGYVVQELLARGHTVVGLDNLRKYGEVPRSHDSDPAYKFVLGDARNVRTVRRHLVGCDHLIAGAAMIGGVAYMARFPYDLLSVNEGINVATFDAAIDAHHKGKLQKITYLSSSMVYASTDKWPSYEGQQREIPPPASSYGFQKLSGEYFARAAHQQCGLPFTIVRPFNCVGLGEVRPVQEVNVRSGTMTLAMGHVVPDLIQKILMGQDPVRILGDGSQVRQYTHGGDTARGIVTAMEHPGALCEDFNILAAESTTVLQLAQAIWLRIKGGHVPFRYVSDPAFEHDVVRRVASVEKAKRVLGFEATTSLSEMLDEVIPWIANALDTGALGPGRTAVVPRRAVQPIRRPGPPGWPPTAMC
jgi:UDP-glucose 4-epimerase